MKSIRIILFLLLLGFNVSKCYLVYEKRSAETTEFEDLSETSIIPTARFPENSDDDAKLQNSLQEVLHEIDEKLGRSHPYGEGGTTQKLKLFFVTPSPEESGDGDYTEALEYSDGENMFDQNVRWTEKGHHKESVKHIYDTHIITKNRKFHNINEISSSDNPLQGTANFPSSNWVKTSPGMRNHSVIHRKKMENETISSSVLRNDSHSSNDQVDMKVELTINLSEGEKNAPSEERELKNASANSLDSINTQNTDVSELATHHKEISEIRNSLLNISTGNLNLNIKLMPHNHTDSGMNSDREEKTGIKSVISPNKVQNGSAPNLGTLGISRRSGIPTNTGTSSTGTRKVRKNVRDMDSDSIDSQKIQKSKESAGHLKNSTMLVKLNEPVALANRVEKDFVGSQKLNTTTPTSVTTREYSTLPTLHSRSANESIQTLSDLLKKEIENITKQYNQEDDDLSEEDQPTHRDFGKFLPGRGGFPEEDKIIAELRKYLSQHDILRNLGLSTEDAESDFMVFLQVLEEMKRSKKAVESGFDQIISYYLDAYNSLQLKDDSDEESSDSEESSYVTNMLDYFSSKDYDQTLIKNGVEAKLNLLKSELKATSESDSDESDYVIPLSSLLSLKNRST